jgi:hypothetical protein
MKLDGEHVLSHKQIKGIAKEEHWILEMGGYKRASCAAAEKDDEGMA